MHTSTEIRGRGIDHSNSSLQEGRSCSCQHECFSHLLLFMIFNFSRGFYTIRAILKAMEVNVDSHFMQFMIHDMRKLPEKDTMYTAAVELAEEIMEGL